MTSDHGTSDNQRSSLFQRIRLRVFALVVASTLAVIGAVSWAALPLWPVVGVAVATVALVFNGITSRLNEPVCWTCGEDISRLQAGQYGSICPGCGALNSSLSSDSERQDKPTNT